MTDLTAAAPARPLRELLPHLIWEAVLLLAAVGVAIGLYLHNDQAFSLGQPWATFAATGFAATALALSLRTGTPNLAIGALGALAGWLYADLGNIFVPLLAVLGAGLVMALLAGLTGVPAWAVTFSGGALVSAILLSQAQHGLMPLHLAQRPAFGLWAVLFAVVSLGGGVLLAVPPVRRFLSANRPAGGEAGAFSAAKFAAAAIGITTSSLLAGAAGILQARAMAAATPYDSGILIYCLAAVLLAGVSPLGRRAGIAGVVLGVVIVDFTRRWETLAGLASWQILLTAAIYALVGVLVVWVLELIGRRVSPLAPAPVSGPGPSPFGLTPPTALPFPAPPTTSIPVAAVPVGPPVVSAPYPVPGSYPTQSFPGQPVPGQPVPGQPVPGQPVSGQPVSGLGVPGQPYPGQPVSAYPVSGQPIVAQPVSGQPYPGQPVPGQPVSAQPVPTLPVSGQPAPGQFFPSQPGPGQSAFARPVSAQPVSAQPLSAQPVSGQPVSAQPVSGQPVPGQTMPAYTPVAAPAPGHPPVAAPAPGHPPVAAPAPGYPPVAAPAPGYPQAGTQVPGYPPGGAPVSAPPPWAPPTPAAPTLPPPAPEHGTADPASLPPPGSTPPPPAPPAPPAWPPAG